MIEMRHKGDFSKTNKYLNNLKKATSNTSFLDKYGKQGVAALSAATPRSSGRTATSWSYGINQTKTGYTISFYNNNINQGVNIAIIIQYGHGTGTGGYVQGIDYINPALQPIFDKIVAEAWREVTSV